MTLENGPSRSRATVILAHGAGAAMDSPFMEYMAVGLGERGLRVVRFEFDYMAASRREGKRKPPDREPKLREAFAEVVRQQGKRRIVIGGKSMGGRIASLIADEVQPLGLICLGYPFHPTGKPDKLRTDHLENLATPTLILQGRRDPFGNDQEVAGYSLAKTITVRWLEDGDHSLKPRKSSGRTAEDNWDEAIEAMADFVDARIRESGA